MTLRPARIEDVPAIAGIFQRARAQAMPWLPVLHSPQEDLVFFGGVVQTQRVWVIDSGEGPMAFAAATTGWLNHLYVDPRQQGTGLGSRLIEAAKDAVPSGLQLWVFEENARARRFYSARGFVEVERTDGSGNEERTPDVRMVWPGALSDLAADGV